MDEGDKYNIENKNKSKEEKKTQATRKNGRKDRG